MGSGARRLLADPTLLENANELHVILTHFHFDHVCGLPYLPWLRLAATIWAPGEWLYETDSAEILAPLRRPPIAPTDLSERYPVKELHPAGQAIDGFEVVASPQPRHWAPSAGLRIDDHVALVTDTPYEGSSAALAEGVAHLLHEAWSSSVAPIHPERDATAADAGRVAREARVGDLTLIHLNPAIDDLSVLLHEAESAFERVAVGEDEMRVS
jgi:ribonuclease BN (tRNA processing enzyme)